MHFVQRIYKELYENLLHLHVRVIIEHYSLKRCISKKIIYVYKWAFRWQLLIRSFRELSYSVCSHFPRYKRVQ
jgi:hypothetical protein